MKILGIDYGTKRVGIALSDERARVAFPHETVANDEQLMAYMCTLVEREHLGAVVIGDTRTASGGGNEVTAALERFAAVLRESIAVPIHIIPEHGTSAAARASVPEGTVRGEVQSPRAKDGGDRNARAAALILQRFLDARKVK